jgi:DNA-binding transcriptional LysR family regulator
MKEIQLHRIDLNLLVVFEALMLEGSVAGAANTLNKTPSAVSHALARLREQVGDPLMVKVGGRMQPSPFALQLIEDVRPILGSIKRVLRLPEPFDPSLSDRTFRIACPMMTGVVSNIVGSLQRTAPNVRIEWLSAPRDVFAAVSEGLIDLALLGGERKLPDGLDEAEMPPMEFVTFLREGHPAIANWGPEAWEKYGHIKVSVSNDLRSPVDVAVQAEASRRRIAALIAEFAAVPPLLSNSDLIATLPSIIMAWDMKKHGLRPMPTINAIPPFRARCFWSSRTANDPALVWIRKRVMHAYLAAHDEAEAIIAEHL